jgi:hypothetical protein
MNARFRPAWGRVNAEPAGESKKCVNSVPHALRCSDSATVRWRVPRSARNTDVATPATFARQATYRSRARCVMSWSGTKRLFPGSRARPKRARGACVSVDPGVCPLHGAAARGAGAAHRQAKPAPGSSRAGRPAPRQGRNAGRFDRRGCPRSSAPSRRSVPTPANAEPYYSGPDTRCRPRACRSLPATSSARLRNGNRPRMNVWRA